jgi:3-phenylpropionate/trans-cinnamate dioxygenase ferredoxin subunit
MTAAATVTLCRLDELADPEARQFVVEGRKIAVVRIGTDVYAIGDTCTHQDFSLAEGEVDPDTLHLECWKHGSQFSLVTGNPDALPATRPVPVYDVRVEGDDVVLALPSQEGSP